MDPPAKKAAKPSTAQTNKPKTNPPPSPLTVSWSSLPPWQRDNAHIHTGYRPARASLAHSLTSLTYLHNESVNIHTHLFGSLLAFLSGSYVYGFVLKPRYEEYADEQDVRVFAAFFGGATVCLGVSAGYHCLASYSEGVEGWGNRGDYLG